MGSGIATSIPLQAELKLANANSTDIDSLSQIERINEVKRLRTKLHIFAQDLKNEKEKEKELARRRPEGRVKVIYERYDDFFVLHEGQLAVSEIDEEYCLSDVMPKSRIELISCDPKSRIAREVAGETIPFIEKKNDSWVDLYTYEEGEPKSWYVLVFQDAAQRASDLKATKERMDVSDNTDGIRVEGCSCLVGNPCSVGNKYNCKNWNNRFAVAKSNGWKGF